MPLLYIQAPPGNQSTKPINNLRKGQDYDFPGALQNKEVDLTEEVPMRSYITGLELQHALLGNLQERSRNRLYHPQHFTLNKCINLSS